MWKTFLVVISKTFLSAHNKIPREITRTNILSMLFCENFEWNKKEVWNFIYVLTICEHTEYCSRLCLFVHFPRFSFMNCRCIGEIFPVYILPLALSKSSWDFYRNFQNPLVDYTDFIHNTGTLSNNIFHWDTRAHVHIACKFLNRKSPEKKISLYWLRETNFFSS